MKETKLKNHSLDALIKELKEITSNPVVEAAFNDAIANVKPILWNGEPNPWKGKTIDYLIEYFKGWYAFLPTPTSGLGKIVPFTYFYYDNESAFYFLNELKSRKNNKLSYSLEIFDWTVRFIKTRGEFMDSKDSLKFIEQWLKDPALNMQDFIVPKEGFKSFNDFFTRKLKMTVNPRPISDPKDDSILTASADSELNFIDSELTLNTPMNTKEDKLAWSTS